MKLFCLTLAALLVLSSTASASDSGMTREQGDAILKELREIRQLLARQQATPAKPENLTLKADATFVLGSSDAPLTLVAYTDYQCPFCGRFEATTFPEIKKKFIDTGKLRFILRDLPLEFHPFALKAAQSVHCAGDQGKYWEMKELVFKNQNKIDVDALAGYAKQLSLDSDTFKHCMDDGKHLQEINDEAKYAHSLGITGTPTFVLGKVVGDSVQGKMIVGAQPLAVFEAGIKEMLEKQN
ncbi:MAG: DsbA family protein [Sideroxydans sp.]|nr:DsbA family protein [Sideroxydans sp.]